MSTLFGIPIREVDIELGDENGIFDYISEDFFQDVALRSNSDKFRWIMALADELPETTRVYALDNSHQGIYTIRDIKNEIEKSMRLQEIRELAERMWEGCHGCDENDKQMWINGFVTGYLMSKTD